MSFKRNQIQSRELVHRTGSQHRAFLGPAARSCAFHEVPEDALVETKLGAPASRVRLR